VKSDLYRANEEIPLDGGYTEGADQAFGGGYAATVSTFAGSHHYRPSTRYTVNSTHFIIPVYFYEPSHCYGFGFNGTCYTDPWGLGFLGGGGLYGGYYGFPGFLYNPYRYLAYRTKIVARLNVHITTVADNQQQPPPPPLPASCSSNGDGGAAANNFANTATNRNICASPQFDLDVFIDPGTIRPAGTTGGQNTATVNVQVTPPRAGRSVTLRLEGVADTGGAHRCTTYATAGGDTPSRSSAPNSGRDGRRRHSQSLLHSLSHRGKGKNHRHR